MKLMPASAAAALLTVGAIAVSPAVAFAEHEGGADRTLTTSLTAGDAQGGAAAAESSSTTSAGTTSSAGAATAPPGPVSANKAEVTATPAPVATATPAPAATATPAPHTTSHPTPSPTSTADPTPRPSPTTDPSPTTPPTPTPTPAPPRTPHPRAVMNVSMTTQQQRDGNGNGVRDAGDVVGSAFVVKNTGDVRVEALELTARNGVRGTCMKTTLEPHSSTTCRASVGIDQHDMDRGSLLVSGQATAHTHDGQVVRATSGESSVALRQSAAIRGRQVAVARSPRPGGKVAAGDRLRFTLEVVNQGNVTLAHLRVTDSLLARAGLSMACPGVRLAPGQATTCHSPTYTVTRAQARRGVLENFATAYAETPHGTNVKTSGTVTRLTVDRLTAQRPAAAPQRQQTTSFRKPSASPTNRLQTRPQPRMSLTHGISSVSDRNRNGRLDAGDTVVYGFHLANTGNVELHDVVVHDKRLDAAKLMIRCPAARLAPGEVMVCIANAWTVTRYQAKHGVGQNFAFATARTPKGTALRSVTSVSVHGKGAAADLAASPEVLARTGSPITPMAKMSGLLLLVGAVLRIASPRLLRGSRSVVR